MEKSYIDETISVFRSLSDISFVKFPCRLEWMLLAVCVKGRISAQIDLTCRTLGPNSIMVLRPGHTVASCVESPDFEGFFIVVHEEKIGELLPSMKYAVPYSLHFMGNPIVELTPEEILSQRTLFNLLMTKLVSVDRPFGGQAVKALVEVLFYDTLGIYARRAGEISTVRSRREELLAMFIDLVELHFKKERSVSFYAQKLCVTSKHLSAVLKETSGRTAGEWIDHRVILEAKTMLRSSGLTIQEISLALNFSNQSFFGKYFKHLTGMSPRQFRANLS